jgi:hypothetical protein
MWLCEKKLLETWFTSNIGMQMYSRFVDDISIKMWVARDAVDATIQKVKLDLNSWHSCIKVDPIVHIVTPLSGFENASGSVLRRFATSSGESEQRARRGQSQAGTVG